jgi:hypothetical protein
VCLLDCPWKMGRRLADAAHLAKLGVGWRSMIRYLSGKRPIPLTVARLAWALQQIDSLKRRIDEGPPPTLDPDGARAARAPSSRPAGAAGNLADPAEGARYGACLGPPGGLHGECFGWFAGDCGHAQWVACNLSPRITQRAGGGIGLRAGSELAVEFGDQ